MIVFISIQIWSFFPPWVRLHFLFHLQDWTLQLWRSSFLIVFLRVALLKQQARGTWARAEKEGSTRFTEIKPCQHLGKSGIIADTHALPARSRFLFVGGNWCGEQQVESVRTTTGMLLVARSWWTCSEWSFGHQITSSRSLPVACTPLFRAKLDVREAISGIIMGNSLTFPKPFWSVSIKSDVP